MRRVRLSKVREFIEEGLRIGGISLTDLRIVLGSILDFKKYSLNLFKGFKEEEGVTLKRL